MLFVALSLLGLIFAYLLIRQRTKVAFRLLIALVLTVGAVNQMYTISGGYTIGRGNDPGEVKRLIVGQGRLLSSVAEREQLDFNLYRFKNDHTHRNIALTANLPSINSFSSTVSPSIDRFYKDIGQSRFVASVNDEPGLRAFLGARYFVSPSPQNGLGEPIAEAIESDGASVYVYEYKDYLPVGFHYKHFVTWEDFRRTPFPERAYLIHRALPLKPEQMALASDLGLTELPEARLENLNEFNLAKDIADLDTIESLNWAPKGFTATLDPAKARNVFFTVPYEQGWTATTADNNVLEIHESMGLMFLEVPEGVREITFRYRTPGLRTGIIITIASAAALGLYLVLARKSFKNKVSSSEKVL